MKYPFTYDEFKAVYGKAIRLTIEVIVQDERGILLTKRSIVPYRGFWHTPGGTVYHGETVEEAVKRIAKNELGVDVKVGTLLGYVEYPGVFKETGFDWPVSLAFLVEVVGGEVQAKDQSSEVQFFTTLPEKIIPEQKAFILTHLSRSIKER